MLSVQVAKDTFYTCLRDRVAEGNAGRTVVVRGVTRPGVVVVENELPGAAVDGIAPVDTFCLRWTDLGVDTEGSAPMMALTCEIRYATDGSQSATGMDRGRLLAAMDVELAAAVGTMPMYVAALSVTETPGYPAAATGTGTNVFWGDVTFGPAVMKAERMERTAQVEVFCYGD